MSHETPDQRSPQVAARREDGTFAEGNSPNPGGQAKWLKQVRADLRNLLPHARATLARVMVSQDEKAAVQAAKVVLEYTVPKPKQTHKIEGTKDPLQSLTPDQLVAFVLAGVVKNEDDVARITGKKEGQ